MEENKVKTALVLEGGAMRGIYTAGVLDVLMDNKIKVDAIIGVSAGALFGINYISNQRGRAIRYNKNYIKNKEYMGLYSLLTTGNIMNKEFCFNRLIYELDKFDFETFKKSNTDFYVTVTNVDTGKAEYIKIKDIEKELEYLRASGSMPLVSEIVQINNKKYLDGGIADSIPVNKAIDLGFDRIIVVLTRPIEYRKKKISLLPYKLMYRKYPEFINTVGNRYINYNNTVEQIIREEENKNIFVIRPSKNPNIKRLEKDIHKVEETYNLGVNDAKSKLEDLINYINK